MEQRRAPRCSVPQFLWLQEQGRGALSELMGAGSVESTGRCLEHQTPSERSSCQGRREGWLPAALAPHSWGEGAGGRHRAGGSQVGTACGGVTPGHGAAGEGRELCKDSLLWDHCCVCRWPGETSLQEMLKAKLLFRHLEGCKASAWWQLERNIPERSRARLSSG